MMIVSYQAVVYASWSYEFIQSFTAMLLCPNTNLVTPRLLPSKVHVDDRCGPVSDGPNMPSKGHKATLLGTCARQ